MEQQQSRIEPQFELGDKILRGGEIPGEIRAKFTSRRGRTLYVVEYMTGVFRVCRASQLQLKAEKE